MHKEWLAYLGPKLDEYKHSADPNERAIYEHVEQAYLAPAIQEITAHEQSKGRMAVGRRRPPSNPSDDLDGMPGVSMDDILR